jgi:hypothetical protein
MEHPGVTIEFGLAPHGVEQLQKAPMDIRALGRLFESRQERNEGFFVVSERRVACTGNGQYFAGCGVMRRAPTFQVREGAAWVAASQEAFHVPGEVAWLGRASQVGLLGGK